MAKVKNYTLYPKDNATLRALKEEYEWLGREVAISKDLQGKKLTILALPKKYERKTRAEAKLKARRTATGE